MTQVMLKVDGRYVGKVLADAQGLFVYHKASASQYHIKHKCSSPVDRKVVDWMAEHGVDRFHAQVGSRNLVTSLERLASAPLEIYGGRERYYLKDSEWGSTKPVNDKFVPIEVEL